MTKLLISAAFVFGLGIAPAFSQTTTETTEAPKTEMSEGTEEPKAEMTDGADAPKKEMADSAETEQTKELDETFPVAADAKPEIKDGQEYRKAEFDDWAVNCIKGSEPENCSLYQLLKDETGNPVAEFSMLALPKGGAAVAGVTFISPLGTLLTQKVAIRIDSGKTARYDFSWCEKGGCISRFGLTNADLAALKRGNAAKVTIASVASPDKPVALKLSLTGITAAWDSISK